MSEALLEEINQELEDINNFGEGFEEGFNFLEQLNPLPEENQLTLYADIAFETELSKLAQKYSNRFEQKYDKTLFALSYIKIKLEQFKERLQAYYTPILEPSEDQLVWFSPECDVDAVIKQCLNTEQTGDVLQELSGIKQFQMARAVTLFKRKFLGDNSIREKEINDAIEIARKAVTTCAEIQLKADIFQSANSQISLKVQANFNNLADSIPEEKKEMITDVIGKFLAYAETKKQMIDVTPKEDKSKRGRGRPRKYPTVDQFE